MIEALDTTKEGFTKRWIRIFKESETVEEIDLYVGDDPIGSDPCKIRNLVTGDDLLDNLILTLVNGLSVNNAILTFRKNRERSDKAFALELATEGSESSSPEPTVLSEERFDPEFQ